MDDYELTQRLAAGDRVAFQELLERFHAPVFRFHRHLTRRMDDAEDLTQDTMLRVRKNAKQFQPVGSLRSWVFTIAYREFIRWHRRHLWLPLLTEFHRVEPGYQDVEDSEWLLGLLSRIPLVYRTTFLLHEVQGLTVAEIARVQSIPEGTVKTRLAEARRRLRQIADPFETEKPSEVTSDVVRNQI